MTRGQATPITIITLPDEPERLHCLRHAAKAASRQNLLFTMEQNRQNEQSARSANLIFYKDDFFPNSRQNPQELDTRQKQFGGAERDRTADPLLAKQVLSQLSYSPVKLRVGTTETRPGSTIKMVGPGRLELPTSRLSGVRSNHLSYGP